MICESGCLASPSSCLLMIDLGRSAYSVSVALAATVVCDTEQPGLVLVSVGFLLRSLGLCLSTLAHKPSSEMKVSRAPSVLRSSTRDVVYSHGVAMTSFACSPGFCSARRVFPLLEGPEVFLRRPKFLRPF